MCMKSPVQKLLYLYFSFILFYYLRHHSQVDEASVVIVTN